VVVVVLGGAVVVVVLGSGGAVVVVVLGSLPLAVAGPSSPDGGRVAGGVHVAVAGCVVGACGLVVVVEPLDVAAVDGPLAPAGVVAGVDVEQVPDEGAGVVGDAATVVGVMGLIGAVVADGAGDAVSAGGASGPGTRASPAAAVWTTGAGAAAVWGAGPAPFAEVTIGPGTGTPSASATIWNVRAAGAGRTEAAARPVMATKEAEAPTATLARVRARRWARVLEIEVTGASSRTVATTAAMCEAATSSAMGSTTSSRQSSNHAVVSASKPSKRSSSGAATDI
jgi:hypothetical protein